MKYVYGFFALCLAIFLIDVGLAHYADWKKRRAELIRNADLNRYAMGAFKGTRDWRHL